jgi:hypothetical protein
MPLLPEQTEDGKTKSDDAVSSRRPSWKASHDQRADENDLQQRSKRQGGCRFPADCQMFLRAAYVGRKNRDQYCDQAGGRNLRAHRHQPSNCPEQLAHPGEVRRDDPVRMARFVWALVHGVAMLTIDGQLNETDDGGKAVLQYAIDAIHSAIATAPANSRRPLL